MNTQNIINEIQKAIMIPMGKHRTANMKTHKFETIYCGSCKRKHKILNELVKSLEQEKL